MAFKVSGID